MLQEAVRVHALVQSLSSTLEGKVTSNQYKVALSDHLYLVMKHFYPVGSSLRLDNTSFSKETRGH